MELDSVQRNPDASLPVHKAQPGPLLAGLLTITLIGLGAVVYWQGEGSLWSVRLIDRLMIRISVVLFSLLFAASALATLFPSVATIWIFRNRRNFTVSFVIAFALHLCAIARFYALDASLFWAISPPLLVVLRCLGVVFIALMLFEALNKYGVQRWKVLKSVAGYYIWIAFLNGFAKRVALDRFYLLPVALLILALALKVAGRMRFNKTSGAPVVRS
jgi:hypothetical protein